MSVWAGGAGGYSASGIPMDAWGRPKAVSDFSILHGVFTFDISGRLWKRKIDGSEVIDGSADTKIYVDNGVLVTLADSASHKYTLNSLRHPRYQPNRGHLYSDAGFVVNPGAGQMYGVVRKTVSGITTETRHAISTSGIDISKGNIFDIQMQWRGVGNFQFFINQSPVLLINQLGTLSGLSITNPAMPMLFEAQKSAHTFGGVARAGSAVRWGIGTEENAIYFEWEYEDERDAQRNTGCCDITSEGGSPASKTYGSVSSGQVTLGSDPEPAIVIRVPETRSAYGQTLINTRDLLLSRINVGASDEHEVSVWYTRDPSAVTITGTAQDWALEPNADVEYVINDDDDAAKTVAFDTSKAVKIFGTIIEVDLPYAINNPNGQYGEFYLTSGDIIAIIFDSTAVGDDVCNTTIEWGAEI